jgi:predicted TIM-barrel fold metal-dependent hydrolase
LGTLDAAIDAWLDQRPTNVSFDLGTMRLFYTGSVHCLMEVAGSHKLCFGTDAPLYWPPAFTRTLQTLDLDPETYERIAWKNALVVFPKLKESAVPFS